MEKKKERRERKRGELYLNEKEEKSEKNSSFCTSVQTCDLHSRRRERGKERERRGRRKGELMRKKVDSKIQESDSSS